MMAFIRARPGWAVALVAVAAATAARLGLALIVGARVPYATYFVAVAVVALSGSTVAVVLTVLLSALAANLPIVELVFALPVPASVDVPWLLRFLLAGGLVAVLTHRLNRARLETDAAVVGAEAHGQVAREERTRLQHIVSSVPGIVWEAWGEPDSSTQRIDYVSDHVRDMLGYSPDEWTSTPNFWLQIVVPEDREAAARVAAETYAAGQRGENEFRWVCKDGRVIWVLARATVIKDDAGRPIGMRGVTLDITARKQAERRLALLADISTKGLSTASFDELAAHIARSTADVIGDYCIVRTMRNGHLDAVAHAHVDRGGEGIVARIAQADVAERGPLFATIVATPRTILDNALTDAAFAHVDRHGLEAEYEKYRARRRIVVPLVSHGRLLGTVAVGRAHEPDYTDADVHLVEALASRAALALDNAQLFAAAQHDAEQARRARAEAEEAGRVKDEFLATLSHELRTPLNAILGWAHMLKDHRVAPERHQAAIDTIVRNAHSQEQLISDILDVQRIIAGRVRLNVSSVDLAGIIRAAAETVRPSADLRQARLVLGLDGDVPPVIGDPDRLKQVVWNLLSNGIKFAPTGGLVEVSLRREGSGAIICVRDDGPGISPAFLPFVFERFRQADSSTTRTHKGLGLGLAIVRTLVELHGGTITAENSSEPGRTGAIFTIHLPPAAPAGADGDRRAAPAEVDLPRLELTTTLDGLRILVVDDDADALELVAEILSGCGATVVRASTADTAFDAVTRTTPDVLVSDIEMPVVDGYTLIRRIRRLAPAASADLPAVALTAYASPADRRKALEAGFDLHLAKPVQPEVLAAAVASVARRGGTKNEERRAKNGTQNEERRT